MSKPRRTSFLFLLGATLLGALPSARPVQAVLANPVIFDGFGDGDVNNNGIPLENEDVDVSGAGDSAIGPYVALGNGGTPMVYPLNTMVSEATTADDAGDMGIPWFSTSGFTTGANADPRVSVHAISDAARNLPETNPTIGYFHSVPSAQRIAAAIDDGLALAAESKGRGNTFACFFGQTISLGPKVNDAVQVSFDFRMWFSAPNFNDAASNHIPAIGELRFGLYEDTDTQLGTTNAQAGPRDSNGIPTPAVWGQEHGSFAGDVGPVGANGDHGWYARIPIDDPENTNFNKPAGGAAALIVEELNEGSPFDRRILSGLSDFVAQPNQGNPQFVNLDVDRVYNISLRLTRYNDSATAGNAGDTMLARVVVTDRATSQSWSFQDYERVTSGQTPDGISSDAWDYFVMGLAGGSDSDDFDCLIDNFRVDVVPEPASAGLGRAALVGLMLAAPRRSRARA